DQVVKDFADAGVEAVLVAFDIETAVATPPCTNEYVAAMRDKYRDRIIQAWAAVDPFKGEVAVRQPTTAIRDLHMLGFHFHPIMGRFAVDDRRFYPLWETIAGLGAPVMIDVGTTGMGAGLPGGLGAKIRHAHPLAIDELAADFPTLTIVAAHPGWPWIDEMTAVALHKGNVFLELSQRASSSGRARDGRRNTFPRASSPPPGAGCRTRSCSAAITRAFRMRGCCESGTSSVCPPTSETRSFTPMPSACSACEPLM